MALGQFDTCYQQIERSWANTILINRIPPELNELWWLNVSLQSLQSHNSIAVVKEYSYPHLHCKTIYINLLLLFETVYFTNCKSHDKSRRICLDLFLLKLSTWKYQLLTIRVFQLFEKICFLVLKVVTRSFNERKVHQRKITLQIVR